MRHASAPWSLVADAIPDARHIVERVFVLHLRQRRYRLGMQLVCCSIMWILGLLVVLTVRDEFSYLMTIVEIGAGILMGGLAGRLLVTRLDLSDVFIGSFGSGSGLAEERYRHGLRDFRRLLDVHGFQRFEARSATTLQRVLGELSDEHIGRWGVCTVHNAQLYDLRLKQWLDARTNGGSEMAKKLSTNAPVNDLNELIVLVHRLGRRDR